MEINLAPNFTDLRSSASSQSRLYDHVVNGSFHHNRSRHVGSCEVDETDEYLQFYLTAQFVTGLIIYPILCITGIIGNLLSIVVLSHKDMATSTNVYLLALCISDTLKLLNDFLYFIMLVISQQNPPAAEAMMVNVYPYAHYVMQVAVSVTAWLTVSVALDRFVSVCFPSRAKTLCTLLRARLIVFGVFIAMILMSIPTAFRYRLQTINDAKTNETCMELVVTELGRNQEFMIPYTWVHNFIRGIIPVFILIFLNARIINVLRKERVKGKKFSSRNRITLMLIAMIVLFIVCITPDAFMSTFFGKGYVEEDFMVKGIREITDSLVTFNSAVNFILYCSLSILFRNTFARIFLGRRLAGGRNESRRPSNFTTGGGGITNHGSGRRKSSDRSSQKKKNGESKDLGSKVAPIKETNETNISMKENGQTENQNCNRTSLPDASGVWLGFDSNTQPVVEQSGGVWLGPVASTNTNTTTGNDKGEENGVSVSSSTECKDDSISHSPGRRECSSNGTSTSGLYTAIDSSDKESTPDDSSDPLNTIDSVTVDNSIGEYDDTTAPASTTDVEKTKPVKKLSWKLDPISATKESPTVTESTLDDNDTLSSYGNESETSPFLTKHNVSDNEQPLLQSAL